MRLILLLVLCFGGLAPQAHAQTPLFTQAFANPLLVNPALAGQQDQARAAINVRNQWVGLLGNYKSAFLGIDSPFSTGKVSRSSWGFTLLADRAGQSNFTQLNASGIYAYEAKFGKTALLRLGVGLGIIQTSYSFFNLSFPDQAAGNPSADPLAGNNTASPAADVQGGAFLYTSRFFIGLSGQHINEPTQQYGGFRTTIPALVQLYTGYDVPLGGKGASKYNLRPVALFRSQQSLQQLDLGVQLQQKVLSYGLWYRGLFSTNSNSAICAIVGFDFDDFAFGYSFDYDISGLTQRNTQGAHEISLSTRFGKKALRKRAIPCPRF